MVKALVLVDVEPKKTKSAFQSIKKLGGVVESMMLYGEYDAMFLVNKEQTLGVQEFVKQVRNVPGITRTVTLIELV